jgi:hypothetical protein
MMRIRRDSRSTKAVALALLSCAIVALVPLALHAQSSSEDPVPVTIQKATTLISNAENDARLATATAIWNLMLNVLAGLAGIIVGLLSQRDPSRLTKFAAVGLGGFIGAVTLVNNTFWAVDASSVMNLADQVQEQAKDLSPWVDELKSAGQTQEAITIEKQNVIPLFDNLEVKRNLLRDTGIKPGSRLFRYLSIPGLTLTYFLNGAVQATFASQMQRQDDAYLYFDGHGTGATLAVASERAAEDARTTAAKYFDDRWRQSGAPSAVQQIKDQVKRIATVDRSTLSRSAEGFAVMTTLKVSRLSMQPNLIEGYPCAAATLNERTWQLFALPVRRQPIILALSDLFRVNRGPDSSKLYVITSPIYSGDSGKFDKNTPRPPDDITTILAFSEPKAFPPVPIAGHKYTLRVTKSVYQNLGGTTSLVRAPSTPRTSL